jgi:hypothetical protein
MTQGGADKTTQSGAEKTAFGPFRVSARAQALADYAAAVGAAGAPFVAPALFLGDSAVKAALAAALPEGFVPVHEAQNVAAVAPLRADIVYVLEGEVIRADAPARLTLDARLTPQDGGPETRLRATLRLFAREGAHA